MKVFIISAIMLMSSVVYSQDVVQVVGLKNAKAKDVATAIKGFGDEDNAIKGFDEDKDKDKDKHKRPSTTDKMAEAMFKRIDVDKNGSLSIKEFKAFYAKIRSNRPSRGPSRGPQAGRPDRGGPQAGRPDRGGPQRGPKRDGLGGPSRGGLKGGPQRGPKGGRGGSDK
jgi:hypothetical protein